MGQIVKINMTGARVRGMFQRGLQRGNKRQEECQCPLAEVNSINLFYPHVQPQLQTLLLISVRDSAMHLLHHCSSCLSKGMNVVLISLNPMIKLKVQVQSCTFLYRFSRIQSESQSLDSRLNSLMNFKVSINFHCISLVVQNVLKGHAQ